MIVEPITQENLASYEKVSPPKAERSNFYYSFSFLPREERKAITSIYAFCSYIDDIVDGTPSDTVNQISKKMDRLAWWENEIENIYERNYNSPLIMPFVAVIKRFGIPKNVLELLYQF